MNTNWPYAIASKKMKQYGGPEAYEQAMVDKGVIECALCVIGYVAINKIFYTIDDFVSRETKAEKLLKAQKLHSEQYPSNSHKSKRMHALSCQ